MSLQTRVTLALVLLSIEYAFASGTHFHKFPVHSHYSFSAQEPLKKAAVTLAKPLIGDDGRVYTCSEKNFYAFNKNGSIAWTITLNYSCNSHIAPVHGGSRKIYLVAENRVLKINPLNNGSPDSSVLEFFGPESGEIIGLAVSVSSSCVIINVRKRGLFAYRLHGQLLWSAGPVLYRHGYRQGCRKNITECYFWSNPVIDHCEASIYISNTEGELYSLSVRSPHFKWIQDFSSFDNRFIVTPANNGILYVTLPVRSLLLALDVSTGSILWQGSTGPLSSEDYAPAVTSNGWISIGSLDGFLYSFSPTGSLKKFPKMVNPNFVIQASPVVDCSGYGVYVSQTEMEGKIGHTFGDYTYVSALKPKSVLFTMLVPATSFVYWSESYPPGNLVACALDSLANTGWLDVLSIGTSTYQHSLNGQFLYKLSQSDLKHFKLDESTLLHFVSASSIGNPLPCHTTRQKFASSCSQTSAKNITFYTGNEKTILLFLLFETTIMITLAALVRFCCIFWEKRKLQSQGLGKFLEKRHSLRLQKKAFDRSITELEHKAAEEALANEALEKLSVLVKEREGIQRKLSTTYSLGRDGVGLPSKSLLPLFDGKARSYSFQGAKKESVTIFHTYSDTSSSDGSSENEAYEDLHEEKESTVEGKGKALVEVQSSSDNEIYENDHRISPSILPSSSRGFLDPFSFEHSFNEIEEERKSDEGQKETAQIGSRSIRRRRALPSID